MILTQSEIFRYSRQFPILGLTGQQQLKQAHVVVVGAGGLGCPVLQQLTASGVGTMTIIDGDRIELSNLPRQLLYHSSDINKPKASCARDHLLACNPHCNVKAIDSMIRAANIHQIMPPCDLIIDASDNFNTRYVLNTYSRKMAIPLISGSIFQFQAQISTFNLNQGPCYECLYPCAPPGHTTPNCAIGGVLGAFTGLIGSIQAIEAIKILCALDENLSGKVLTIDGRTLTMKTFHLPKQCECNPHSCSKENTMSTAPKKSTEAPTITPKELQEQLQKMNVKIIDVREDFECEICKIENSIHIPLGKLAEKAKFLDPKDTYVVHCKAGIRGNQAALLLKEHGFTNVYNLKGGILQWIEEVDPHLRRY